MFKVKINRKSTWFLIMAIVIGGLLAMKIDATMKDVKKEVEVVQAAKDIPAYTVLTKEMLVTKKVPSSSVVDGTYPASEMKDLYGKYTAIGILAHTNIQKGHVISSDKANVSALLYSLKNNELISISVPLAANDIGNQINPGDTIHLNGVFSQKSGDVITKYVAQYVPVIGVDKKDDGTAKIYVAVKKESFPDIARSIDTGRIRAAIAQKDYQEVENKKIQQDLQQKPDEH